MDTTRALHKAVEDGELEAVQRLLQADPYLVASREDYRLTPLHRAAMADRAAAAAALLDRSADPEAKDHGGGAPLHWAAARGARETAAVLLERGAKPDARDQEGLTPLHRAAEGGQAAVAALLLARGADANAQSKLSGTPLHAAAAQGHLNMVELLLAHGGLANARSKGSHAAFTPWHAARQAGHTAVAALLRDHGGQDAADSAISVHRAAEAGYLGRLKWLLQGDPGLAASRDFLHRRTPLHWAAGAGQAEAAELLLAHGAELDARDKAGQSPLERAEAAGHAGLAERLRAAQAGA